MRREFLAAIIVAGTLLSVTPAARATFVGYGSPIGFQRITFNHPEDVGGVLSVQLGSDSAAPGYAAFRFDFASGSIALNPEISSLYLEDGGHSGSKLFAVAPGTIFSPNPYFDATQSSGGVNLGTGTPSTGLPGAGTLSPAFVNRSGYLASNTIGAGNGINQGEHAVLLVKLNPGITLNNVLGALLHPVLNGSAGYDLRFGLQEVNSQGGSGDGYVNLQAPEPATMGVWALGMGIAGCIAAWRRKKATA